VKRLEKLLTLRNFPLTNDMKKANYLNLLLFILINLFFTSCDNPKLKPPREDDNSDRKEMGANNRNIDREFARELAREFGREFAIEFARQMKGSSNKVNMDFAMELNSTESPSGLTDGQGKPHALLAHCSEDVLDFYRKHSDCFSISSMDEIPQGLIWQDASEGKEFSSSQAKKGGTWQVYTNDFPRTLRTIGPDANGAFRSYLLDYNVISLVEAHPNSDSYYPGLAKSWAVGKDGRTVYFRLDPNARYSDGEKVKVSDFFFFFYFMRSKHIQAPWYNDFYGKDKFQKVTIYDKETLSITFYKAKPDIIERVAIRAKPEHFYEELDGEFLSKYQWIPEPTTGAYAALPENVDKGKSITLVRQKDWWADQKRFFRYRYNPEKIKVSVVRDHNKAFEIFLKGGLDMFGLAKTEFWYDKLPNDHKSVQNGYLSKVTFFNQTPPPSYALRINSQKPPFDDLNVRIGFHHAMNFDLVIKKIFRSDFVRMNTAADGYGGRSHPTLKAREFSVEQALEYFAKADFKKRGGDGILINSAGERLSIELLTGYKRYEDVLVVLKEQAKKAGLEIKLKVLEQTAAWKAAKEKNHQVIFSAFNSFVELFPRFWEPFHSDNAYEEEGDSKFNEDGSLKANLTTKVNTNNYSQTAVRDIDHLINQYRNEENLDRITEMSHQLSQMIHNHAVWVPAWKKPWLRLGHWNWIKFPEDWGPKETREYEEFQVFWIDEPEKDKILEAMAKDEPFSEKPTVRNYEKYKSN
jgi:microcin C transport system substrate-binding protein